MNGQLHEKAKLCLAVLATEGFTWAIFLKLVSLSSYGAKGAGDVLRGMKFALLFFFHCPVSVEFGEWCSGCVWHKNV